MKCKSHTHTCNMYAILTSYLHSLIRVPGVARRHSSMFNSVQPASVVPPGHCCFTNKLLKTRTNSSTVWLKECVQYIKGKHAQKINATIYDSDACARTSHHSRLLTGRSRRSSGAKRTPTRPMQYLLVVTLLIDTLLRSQAAQLAGPPPSPACHLFPAQMVRIAAQHTNLTDVSFLWR